MNYKSAFITILFCAAASGSVNAFAASDASTDSSAAANASKDQPKAQVRPHSHLEEKTGIITKKTEDKKEDDAANDKPKAKKTNPWKDKDKHFHPRDGK